MKKALLVLAIVLIAAPAFAQNVKNPSGVQFQVSDDHAVIDGYVLGWFADINAAAPMSEVSLGKPTPDANGLTPWLAINAQPLSFKTNYVVRVRAVAGTTTSDWSTPSNPWDRVPGGPSKIVAK